MIELLLGLDLGAFELSHVRMDFSREMAEVGRFRVRKIVELVRVISAILIARLRTGASVLYYPPSGPELFPILRDICILLGTRWAFRRTIFHFHAGGVMAYVGRLNFVLRSLANVAYRRPDLSIRTTNSAPEDGERCGSRLNTIVLNGVEDLSTYAITPRESGKTCPRLLFVGVIREDKGVLVLVEAARQLMQRGHHFELMIVGSYEPLSFQDTVRSAIEACGLGERVLLPGVLSGRAKAQAFATSDIFCFPSFFSSETFGLVLAEAMSVRVPIVATRWRGIPDVVDEGVDGFLVPIQDAGALADRIEQLLLDDMLRWRMGEAGRAKFESRYTREAFGRQMHTAFELLRSEDGLAGPAALQSSAGELATKPTAALSQEARSACGGRRSADPG
jgi:glycosyltransferase involved in cell wall biosynthesis